MSPSLRIGGRELRSHGEPYIIAEIGVNHGASLSLAKRLIDLAREGGAHAAKFQTYKADTLAAKNSPAYWDVTKEPTDSQHRLFQKYDAFGIDEYRLLADHCRMAGIDFLSTPFDLEAVDALAPLMSCFKIASADLTNVPLLRQAARHKKPILLSTGASTLAEVDVALNELEQHGATDIALLHCILQYPTPDENGHLAMIRGLQRAYPELVIGYSDHTVPDPGMLAVTTAFLLGAAVIEKHFTHDKTLPGNDHYHAMDVHDLRRFVANVAHARTLLGGTEHKRPIPAEEPARQHARRSIVLARPLAAGTVLSGAAMICKRPGSGISPLHWDDIVGRRVRADLPEDHILGWDDLEPARA
jgi:N-acetylneuraminate synthase